MTPTVYRDRTSAGRSLARRLSEYAGRSDVVVLALPRGGVPVASEVARALGAPLDVFVVRKLGVPGHEELAMGAIAQGGDCVINQEVVRRHHIPLNEIDAVIEGEQAELRRRERAYRNGRVALDVRGKTLIVVDDGLATGATMRAAVVSLKRRAPAGIVVAVPTASATACESFREFADHCICDNTPEPFRSVGEWYEDFRQTTDEEVRELLQRSEDPADRSPVQVARSD